jgi:hypothetical protein
MNASESTRRSSQGDIVLFYLNYAVLSYTSMEITPPVNDDSIALEIDVLTSALSINSNDNQQLMELLAQKLERALPDAVAVDREGSIFSSKKRVREITITFEEFQYQLVCEKNKKLSAKKLKLVRGIALKTTDIEFAQWVSDVAAELAKMAAQSATARDALNKMVGLP